MIGQEDAKLGNGFTAEYFPTTRMRDTISDWLHLLKCQLE